MIFDTRDLEIRENISKYSVITLMIVASLTIVILAMVVVTMIYYGWEFLRPDRLFKIITTNNWNPGETVEEGNYGAFAMIYGTLVVGAVSLFFAIILGVGSAIVLSEFMPNRISRKIQPVVEFIAAIPSVILGLIAFRYISEWVTTTFGTVEFRDFTASLGYGDGFGIAVTSGRVVLTASIAISFLAAPIITSISYDAMQSTPAAQRQAAKAFGATRLEVFRTVVYPHAKKSIYASILLAFGRLVGETMVVLMVLGSSTACGGIFATLMPDQCTASTILFSPGYTLTAAIAGEPGDAVFEGAEFRVLFVLGLLLLALAFIIVSFANMITNENKYLTKFAEIITAPFSKISEFISGIRQRLASEVTLDQKQVKRRITIRRITNIIYSTIYGVILVAFIGIVFYLLFVMMREGFHYFTKNGSDQIIPRIWNFLTAEQSSALRNAGDYSIPGAIVGSGLLVGFACLIAFPISTMAGIYLFEFAKDNRFTKTIQTVIINISAIPSIVVGLFVYGLFSIGLGWSKGVLPGAIALGIMMIPIVTTNTIEALRNIPDEHRVSAIALGSTKFEAVIKHKLPYSFPAIITGYILSIARVIGETAPLIWTAAAFTYGGSLFPDSLINEEIRALPYEIFYNLLYEPKQIDGRRIGPEWALAVSIVLLIVVALLNLLAYVARRLVRKKYEFNGGL